MNAFNWLFDPTDCGPTFNPTSGLLMLNDSGLDIAGNPYGTDFFTHSDPFPSTWMFDTTGFGGFPWE